jgi:serine/threonine protein kinase
MAPEAYKLQYTFKSDIYSIGIIMYVLLTGNLALEVRAVPDDNNNQNYKNLMQR